jgi:hypothetical protein
VAVRVKPFLSSPCSDVSLFPRPSLRLRGCDLGSGRSHACGVSASHDLRSVSASGPRPPEPAGASGPWRAPRWTAPAQERSATRPLAPLERPTPAPSRRTAVSGGATSRRWQGGALRHAPGLAQPPQGPAPLARQGDHPAPASAATTRPQARLIPRGQRARRRHAPPAPGQRAGQRAAGRVAGGGAARLGGGGATRRGGGGRPLKAPTACRGRHARPPKHARPNRPALWRPLPVRLSRGGPGCVPASAAVWRPARRSASPGARRGVHAGGPHQAGRRAPPWEEVEEPRPLPRRGREAAMPRPAGG